jgi:hypothetical protein
LYPRAHKMLCHTRWGVNLPIPLFASLCTPLPLAPHTNAHAPLALRACVRDRLTPRTTRGPSHSPSTSATRTCTEVCACVHCGSGRAPGRGATNWSSRLNHSTPSPFPTCFVSRCAKLPLSLSPCMFALIAVAECFPRVPYDDLVAAVNDTNDFSRLVQGMRQRFRELVLVA